MTRSIKIAIVVLLILALVLLIRFSDFLFLYPSAKRYFFDTLGWPESGAALGAFVVTAIVHTAQGSLLLWALFGARKWEAMGVLGLFFLGQFILSLVFQPKFAQSSGESIRYWSKPVAGGCIKTTDAKGFDPVTGEERKPVDRDIARIINLCERGVFPRPISLSDLRSRTLFDPNSGEPVVFYSGSTGGAIDLFDNPGFHPALGERLLPVTQDVARTLLDQEAERVQGVRDIETQRQQQQEAAAKEQSERMKLAYPPELRSITFSTTKDDCSGADFPEIDRSAEVISICAFTERARRNYTILMRSVPTQRMFFGPGEWVICEGPLKEGWENVHCSATRPQSGAWTPGRFNIEIVVDGRRIGMRTLVVQ